MKSGANSTSDAWPSYFDEMTQAAGEIAWDVFLTPAFMQRHTRFASLEELSAECGLPATTQADLRANRRPLDIFIRMHTPFDGLTDMLRTALREWSEEHLG